MLPTLLLCGLRCTSKLHSLPLRRYQRYLTEICRAVRTFLFPCQCLEQGSALITYYAIDLKHLNYCVRSKMFLAALEASRSVECGHLQWRTGIHSQSLKRPFQSTKPKRMSTFIGCRHQRSEDSRTPRPSSPALSESNSDNRTTSHSALSREQGKAFPSSWPEQERKGLLVRLRLTSWTRRRRRLYHHRSWARPSESSLDKRLRTY
jgi:hypothetical protein